MEHVPPQQLIGVLMTGMGNDGAEAMASLRAARRHDYCRGRGDRRRVGDARRAGPGGRRRLDRAPSQDCVPFAEDGAEPCRSFVSPPGRPAPPSPARDSAAVLRRARAAARTTSVGRRRARPRTLPGGVPALGDALGARDRARAFARPCSRAWPGSPRRRASRSFCRSCAPTTHSCARERSDALRAMKDVAWPAHRGAAAGPRCRRADSRLRSGPRHAGRNGRAPCSATCSTRSRSRTSVPRPSRCSRRSADRRRCPLLARCAERFRATPFLEFAIKIAIDGIRSQATDSHVPDLRRSPRTNIAGFANSSTDEPGWSSPKRNAITSSGAWSSAWRPRIGLVRKLFRAAAHRPAGRDRAVRQRVHRQRDVLLSRGAPARVPHGGPAGRNA